MKAFLHFSRVLYNYLRWLNVTLKEKVGEIAFWKLGWEDGNMLHNNERVSTAELPEVTGGMYEHIN